MSENQRYIIKCQGGHDLSGYQQPEDTKPGYHVLHEAVVIRQWGTTKGIGQLALEGVQSGTVLDHCGTAMIPHHAVVWMCPCTSAWK